ncbi:MAG: zinc ribbon domain-containing protein [Armatimonadota bacterium]|nr:zinc ribbon domain-containing protein [Armatimonadota bacterium]MDR7444358.1 zinc ribbon domain-containing protein [Armatimonadota bacterium]MDR7569651.1 zinc ribbon domain-containing protein [Armatimonadota bacterium]MDR7614845.1 zinc ribbon domain-containing protein [Armatimonadota bacterium]
MPIYEYVCETCGERFEELVLGRSWQTVTCASCGSQQVRRVISVFAVGRAEGNGDLAPCGPNCCRLQGTAET